MVSSVHSSAPSVHAGSTAMHSQAAAQKTAAVKAAEKHDSVELSAAAKKAAARTDHDGDSD